MIKLTFRFLTACMVLSITIVCIVYIYLDNKIIPWNNMPSNVHAYGKPNQGSKQAANKIMLFNNVLNTVTSQSSVHLRRTESCATSVNSQFSNISTSKIMRILDSNTYPTHSVNKPHVSADRLLTIIVIPHSHNDPGWLNTFDEYFQTKTKLILNNMLAKLVQYPKMTFVWAESILLWEWMKELSSEEHETVKLLISRRQLEIVGGGWVVPDEATTHYFALIDQMIEGHQWLETNLHVRPTINWALDPFGYSATISYLYQRAGFHNMVILRVHEQLKNYLADRKQLEFIWQQSWPSAGIFTHMMPYKLYNIEHSCGPNKTVCMKFDFRIPDYSEKSSVDTINEGNVQDKARLLLAQYRKKSALYRHDVILVPLGDDFRYDDKSEWDMQYTNYMQLFDYINNDRELNANIKFGTPSDYFDLVSKNKAASFPTLAGDFFPYSDNSYQYWTGYFTTRPYNKLVGRTLEARLRAAEILQSLAGGHAISKRAYFPQFHHNTRHLIKARRSLALFQHHDAITGTSKPHVVDDYLEKLQTALNLVDIVASRSASYLLSQIASVDVIVNVSGINNKYIYPDKRTLIAVKDKTVNIVVFNTLALEWQQLISINVDTDQVMVTDNTGRSVISQLNPVWTDNGRIKSKEFELVFLTRTLSPFSMSTYQLKFVTYPDLGMTHHAYIGLQNTSRRNIIKSFRFKMLSLTESMLVLENSYYRAEFSPLDGSLQSIATQDKFAVRKMRCTLQFLLYKARGSGAYIFQPAGSPGKFESRSAPIIRIVKGPLVSEIHVIRKQIEHRVSLINSTGAVGASLYIHNIVDMSRMKDREIIMRLLSEIRDNDTFYTDQNGFQMMRRRRFRNLPREANYHPMTSTAYVEDAWSRLSLLGAQSLGVGSEAAGSLEVMLDRHLLYDDQRGLGEGVADNRRTSSRFALILEHRAAGRADERGGVTPSTPTLLSHQLTALLQQPALVLVASAGRAAPPYRPLLTPLPADVQLVNLRSLAAPGHHRLPAAALILRRLASDCRYDRHGRPPGGAAVQIGALFRDVRPTNVSETTLSLMYTKRYVARNESTRLLPMELYTFKLHF